VTSTVTSPPTRTIVQPFMRDRDPCHILALCRTTFLRNSPADSFIVPHLLSIACSIETMLPMNSQVVKPPVRGFNFLAIPGCGHPSNTLVSGNVLHSSLHGTLPCLVRCGHIHDSRVTTLSNAVVGLARLGPIMLSFSRPACAIPVSSLLISSSNVMLFFLSHAHYSSSS